MTKLKFEKLSLLALLVYTVPAFIYPSKTPDWPSFYAGAKLVGSPELYTLQGSCRITKPFATQESKRLQLIFSFIRPPFYAAILWPLGLLSPHAAFIAWQAANLCALMIFVWMWSRSWAGVLIAILFPPLIRNFQLGQDIPLMLLVIASSAVLYERKRVGWAGAVLALSAIKFHLFLLLPVVLAVRKEWRYLAGMAAGGAALALVSAAVSGVSWPVTYALFVLENEALIKTGKPPSVIGLIEGPVFQVAFVLLVLGAVCFAARTQSLPLAFSVALMGGLLIAPRFFSYDVSVMVAVLLAPLRSHAPHSGKALLGAGRHCHPCPTGSRRAYQEVN